MDPEELIWSFRCFCDSWRSVVDELKALRDRLERLPCTDAVFSVLNECIQEYETEMFVIERLEGVLGEAYYEYSVSGTPGNLANIRPLFSWQAMYCMYYPDIEKSNCQLVRKLDLIQYEILHIEEKMRTLMWAGFCMD